MHSINPYKVNQPIGYRTCHNTSHDWMHLGKYTVYLNLPLIIGVALFCLHILEGADTAYKFGRQLHTESITRAYVIISD